MGASFDYFIINEDVPMQEVKQRYDDEARQSRHESGHSYSGGIGMATGVVFPTTKCFASQKEAFDFVSHHAGKWGPALAVRFQNVQESLQGERTFDGREPYGFEGYTISREVRTRWAMLESEHLELADQVPEEYRREFMRLLRLHRDASNVLKNLGFDLKQFTDLVHDVEADLDLEVELPRVGELREEYRAELEKLREYQKQLIAINEKLEAELIEKKTKDLGVQWFVGAWCAS